MTPNPIDAYLANVPEPARTTLQKTRERILAAMPPGAIECISYRLPTIKHPAMRAGISFAAFQQHCSLFVLSGTLLESFQEELKAYRLSKGTIRFPPDKPLPAALVRKLVKARLALGARPAR